MRSPDTLIAVVNPRKPDIAGWLDRIETWCGEQGWAFVQLKDDPGSDRDFGERALGLALGGDGTLLHAARWLAPRDVPILGVNLGSLGFLSALPADRLWEALERIASRGYDVEARARLGISLPDAPTALNEFALVHPRPDVVTEVELHRGDELVASYPGDGVVLATATGSTAYSLAAGGPVVAPELEVVLVVPLNPHKLGLRPLVLSGSEPLTVHLKGPATLLADGDRLEELPAGSEFQLSFSTERTRLARVDDAPGWFALLEEKLYWQRRSPKKTYYAD